MMQVAAELPRCNFQMTILIGQLLKAISPQKTGLYLQAMEKRRFMLNLEMLLEAGQVHFLILLSLILANPEYLLQQML